MKTVIWAVLAAVLAGAVGFYGGVIVPEEPSAIGGLRPHGWPRRIPGARETPAAPAAPVATGSARSTRRRRDGHDHRAGRDVHDDQDRQTAARRRCSSRRRPRSRKQEQLTAADLKVGDQVAAIGQSANGGIDARSITVVPPGCELPFRRVWRRPGAGRTCPERAVTSQATREGVTVSDFSTWYDALKPSPDGRRPRRSSAPSGRSSTRSSPSPRSGPCSRSCAGSCRGSSWCRWRSTSRPTCAFTPIQFGLRNLPLAAVDIVVVLLTIVWWIALAWRPGSEWIALVLSPYLVWVSIATVLQFSITLMNR